MRPIRRSVPFLVAALLLLAGSALATGTLTITVIDVGQGDATLIESPSGQTLLFDGGNNHDGDDIILPLLAAKGLTSLDYTVASHYHADHVAAWTKWSRASPWISLTIAAGVTRRSPTTTTPTPCPASARPSRRAGHRLGEGVTVTCIALNSADVLDVPYTNSSYENEYDVVLLVQYGGFDYFQAGDLTGGGLSSEDIESTVADLAGNLDVYHVNHHGSNTSSNAYFLQTTTAEVGVISVGDNSYGHPTQDVLDRLDTYGLFVYQTEAGEGGTLPSSSLSVVGGHVVITTDGVTHFYVDGDQWALDETSSTPGDEFAPLALRCWATRPIPSIRTRPSVSRPPAAARAT